MNNRFLLKVSQNNLDNQEMIRATQFSTMGSRVGDPGIWSYPQHSCPLAPLVNTCSLLHMCLLQETELTCGMRRLGPRMDIFLGQSDTYWHVWWHLYFGDAGGDATVLGNFLLGWVRLHGHPSSQVLTQPRHYFYSGRPLGAGFRSVNPAERWCENRDSCNTSSAGFTDLNPPQRGLLH